MSKCVYSGHQFLTWLSTNSIKVEAGKATCPGCGRTLKVRDGLRGVTWKMLPHHNKPKVAS